MERKLRDYGTLCILMVACNDVHSQQQKEVVDTQEHKSVSSEPQDPINPGVIAEMPEFPGGMEKLIQFIEENTHLPKCVTDGKVQGRSVIEMVVEKDGFRSHPCAEINASLETSQTKRENCTYAIYRTCAV